MEKIFLELNNVIQKSSESFNNRDKQYFNFLVQYCMTFTKELPHIFLLTDGGVCIEWMKINTPSFGITIWKNEVSAEILDSQIIYVSYEEKNDFQITLINLQKIAQKYFLIYYQNVLIFDQDWSQENELILNKVNIELPKQIARYKAHYFLHSEINKWVVFIGNEIMQLFENEFDAYIFASQESKRLNLPPFVTQVGHETKSYSDSLNLHNY